MNIEELLGVALALGVFIGWGNRRIRQGRRPPEDSRVFGALLLIAFGVGMYLWLKSTGQLG